VHRNIKREFEKLNIMSSKANNKIEVFAHWRGLKKPYPVGVLSSFVNRGAETFSFEYDADWLKSSYAQLFDPKLGLYSGLHYPPQKQSNFGVFLDSSPDRWGRVLMKRREAHRARQQGRKPELLWESDFLLGVHDEQRSGALRFKLEIDGSFLDDDPLLAAPPWASLNKLEYASMQLEQEGAEESPEYIKWLKMLMAPGSSLGGARPKAGVKDEKGRLWIAKFPSRHDEIDIGAWEFIVNRLAKLSGIEVSQCQSKIFNGQHHTFISKRFDRTEDGERIHFASAMTLLQHKDGDDASTDASYLEFAEFLTEQGASVNEDLEQLWKRIVFSVCISNVDDHLRNHGFLLTPKGWRLSPTYDINPDPYGEGLKLNISDSDNSQDLELLRDVSEFFRVKQKRADEIITHIVKTVRTWRIEAKRNHISNEQQEYMARAFRIADE